MGWFGTLVDAIRGSINEAGEELADKNAIIALEQSIRDAKNEMSKAKEALTEVMAQEKLAAKRVAELKASLEEHEGYAAQADEKGDEALFNDIADRIIDIQEDFDAQSELHNGYAENVRQLKGTILESERSVKAFEREIKNLKATEAAQRAAAMTAEKYSGASSSMTTAAERIARVKEKQQQRGAKMEAARELASSSSGSELKDRMKQAGIIKGGGSREDIRARLRAKKAP
ncbi:PspA/IM30 family protein [Ectothiorhodospiraceae bacterium BW-2]|nr:PspA/IM30 family protein [Ectothiorhodospiraceae bacterium BW-2]